MAALHLLLLSSIGNELTFIQAYILHYDFWIAPFDIDFGRFEMRSIVVIGEKHFVIIFEKSLSNSSK